MFTPYDETADFLLNHEMAISPIFRFLLQAQCTFFLILLINYEKLRYRIHRIMKYDEKAIYDVPVAPVLQGPAL